MTDIPIRLADYIAAIRAELTEAAIIQEQREALAKELDQPLRVPPLLVNEIRLEVEVVTQSETKTEAGGKASLGIKFWVVSSAEATGSHALTSTTGRTQKLSLTLQPRNPLHLGSERKQKPLLQR